MVATRIPGRQLKSASENSVTGSATAILSDSLADLVWNTCTGTSVDYSLNLPAVSGNTGKYCAIRMAPALTKLVTVDANGAELINGVLTLVMRNNESAILFCDGAAWAKVAGVPIPLVARFGVTQGSAGEGSQDIPNATTTKVNVNTIDVQSLDMANTTTDEITIKRAGNYRLTGAITYNALLATASNVQVKILRNSTEVANSSAYSVSGAYPVCYASATVPCSAGDVITLNAYHNTGNGAQSLYVEAATGPNYLEVSEVL